MKYLVKTKGDLLYTCLLSSCIRSLITFDEKTLVYHIMSLRGKVWDYTTSLFPPCFIEVAVQSQDIQHSYM